MPNFDSREDLKDIEREQTLEQTRLRVDHFLILENLRGGKVALSDRRLDEDPKTAPC